MTIYLKLQKAFLHKLNCLAKFIAFYCKTMTMNFIIVAKFFYNKYDRVFILLFAVGQIKEELLKSILNYFANIKINNH